MSADLRNLVKAVLLLAAFVAILSLGQCAARADGLPPALEQLCQRLDSPKTPQWKRDLLPRIRARTIGMFEARVTLYCPNNPIDPLGGGAWGAWGPRLRRGHCAVGTTRRAAPYGTVLYCPSVMDHLQVVVDCGPGVQGSDRIDICEPDPEAYLALDRHNWKRYPCWVLGRVTKEQVR